jgi:hypothetical protein
MIGHEPVDDCALAATGVEINGQAVTMLGWLARRRDDGTRATGRDDADRPELALDPVQQRSRLRLKAGAGGSAGGIFDE